MKDQRKGLWKIVKKTENGAGGWARYGGRWYLLKEEAENHIDHIVEQYPDEYIKG